MTEPTPEEYKQRLETEYDIFGGGVYPSDVEDGDLILLDEWLKEVNGGGFIDYDCHGEFAFDRGDGVWLTSNMPIRPSDITKFKITPPKWATHVLWFNR
jgi:hypothetical protein